MKAYTRWSPYLEQCCLLVSANESYERAAEDIAVLTGVKVTHSTQHRLVHRQTFQLPQVEATVEEMSVDGGKVRLRTFFPLAIGVIVEGEQRYPNQKIVLGAADPLTGKPAYVDYRVKLPGRSLNEFLRWVNRFMHQAIVLAPADLAAKHRQAAIELVQLYQREEGNQG